MHYLLFYDVVPDYVERRAAHRSEHLTPARAAYARGELVPGGALAEATRRYVRAVGAVLDDLKVQGKKATEYEKTAVWRDSAANTIEARSVTGVDKSAVEYGAGTAARLRALADSLRGVPGQVAALDSQAYAVGYVPRATMLTPFGPHRNPFLGSAVSVSTNLPEIRVKQMEAVKQDAANRAKLWKEIDKKRSEIELTLNHER